MKSAISVFIIISFALFSTALGTTINVPGDYSTIQAAINASSNGDTVLVADGIYNENIDFIGKAIVVVSENGYENATIQSVSVGSPTVMFNSGETSLSVIQGFTITGATNAPGIEVISSSPLIYGNHVFDNHGGGGPHNNGGGIYCQSSAATIRRNLVTENSAGDGGGGISVWYSPALIDSNIVFNNTVAS